MPLLQVALLSALTLFSQSDMPQLNYLNKEQYAHLIQEHSKSASAAIRWDKVPIEFNEQILITGSGSIAICLLYIIPVPYDELRACIKDAVSKRYGIKRETCSTKKLIYRYDDSAYATLGMRRCQYDRCDFITEGYNKKGKSSISGTPMWSELHITVADGSKIFQKPYSLIEVSRKDNWLDWAGGHPVIQWLPWKENKSKNVLTNNEVDFINRVIGKFNPAFVLTYVNKGIWVLATCENGTRISADLKEHSQRKASGTPPPAPSVTHGER